MGGISHRPRAATKFDAILGEAGMNVLLLSMPDNFEHMSTINVRMPNAALSSLAGNIDAHHKVAVADLILAQNAIPETITRLMAAHDPTIVGLSIMTFQRHTAFAIIDFVRALKPGVLIVVGGYDPSLARKVYTDVTEPKVDFVVRGEGEITFRELIRAVERGGEYEKIDGLSFLCDGSFRHNPDRSVNSLDNDEVRLPDRSARVLSGYTVSGRQVDVVESSRGCTFDCSFCSIIEMRGRNFHRFDIERVIDDIRDAADRGARSIFFADDNITLNVRRFEALCQAIIDAGLNSIDYSIQAMTSAIADHGEKLAPLMRKAGFRYVFLGIENIVEQDLDFLNANAKNKLRIGGRRVGNASTTAIKHLHDNGMLVVGGLIVGSPADTRENIASNLKFAWKWVDWPYIQHPTPYPGTPMAADFEKLGLIANRNLAEYDGTTAIVACENMPARDIEFMRWKAERWIKLRHGWAAYIHDAAFWREHGIRFLRQLFRGVTLASMIGLESKRKAFERYCALRKSEREYTVSRLKELTGDVLIGRRVASRSDVDLGAQTGAPRSLGTMSV